MRYRPVPVVRALSVRTKAEAVVPVVATEEVRVWLPVPLVRLIAVAPVALPIVMVLALALLPMLTAPVVVESSVTALAPVEFRARVVVPVMVPAPAKVRAVALVAIVSSEATPVRAPAVETLRPPEAEISWKVPVALPMVMLPVPVVAIVTLLAPALARSVTPVEVRVVNLPVEAVLAPMVVELMLPPVMVTPELARVLAVRVWVTVRAPVLVVVMPVAPRVRAEVLAVPIWTTPLVEVPVPACSTKLPPVEVVPVLLEALSVRLEPVPLLVVESPGWIIKAVEVPALAVVKSLAWAPARVTAPPLAILKLEDVRVRALAPNVQVEARAPVKLRAPDELMVATPLPLPMLEVPVLLSVLKAPVEAVVAPMAVELIPVAVVLKVEAPVPEVMVRALVP